MSEMNNLDKFLEERGEIPLPSGDVARVKLLAKELALGVHKNLWSLTIPIRQGFDSRSYFVPTDRILRDYLEIRRKDIHIGRHLPLLRGHGYLDYLDSKNVYRLTKAAFDLIDETEPYNVFISYKRSESSALALLVLARLKASGPAPFMDMMLEPGEKWHAELEERIRDCDYFIVLLGKKTLYSDMTVKEIKWALQHEKAIIPVWHSGFDLSADKWEDTDSEVKDAIQQTNAIRVTDESASGYNTAIVELLSRFGIMPV